MINTQDLYEVFKEADGICTDTRNIIPGTLFFALKGANFDGNEFALQAIGKGCVAAIVDDQNVVGEKIYHVQDVLLALQNLAHHHRKQFNIPIIGITGSNGKTTTKELIGAVLKTKYNVLVTEGNLNNHLGVPFTLLKLNPEHEIVIVEMGANKPGDIKELAEIAEPTHGIITNIGAAHIEGFGSIEGVIQTKTELYRNIEANKGVIFYNFNDEILTENLPKNIENQCYGKTKDAGVHGGLVSVDPFLNFEWKVPGVDKIMTHSKLVGSYNLPNFLAAIAIGHYFEIDPQEINRALEGYTPSNNRSQITKTERNTLVVDCYNANATSMKAAIQNFHEIKHPNKWLILGSMKELGAISKEEHQKVFEQARATDCHLILVGSEFKGKMAIDCFETTAELIESKELEAIKEGLVLLKASRGIGLEKLIPEL